MRIPRINSKLLLNQVELSWIILNYCNPRDWRVTRILSYFPLDFNLILPQFENNFMRIGLQF